MPDYDITITSHKADVIEAMKRQGLAALEAVGLKAEKYAKMKCPVGTPTSTGIAHYVSSGLRQSITHKVAANELYIGTNHFYGKYVELGTGIYASNGKGRKSPWVWRDKNGKAHFTHGMKPRHYLRDAASDHKEEYRRIFIKYLRGTI
jgi:HK97 gp10 family phage protein